MLTSQVLSQCSSTRNASSSLLSEVEDVDGPQESIDYSSMTVKELKVIAKKKSLEGYSNMTKDQLIEVILET